MGFIERLRQEAEAKERVQQAAEAFKKLRKNQATAFQKESGVGDLVLTVYDLLKKTRLPDAIYLGRAISIVQQGKEDVDSVFDGIRWSHRDQYGEIELGNSYDYISTVTRPSGEIVFYARETTLIPRTDWRNDKGILELTLERALKSPGMIKYTPERGRGISEPGYGRYLP